MICRLLRPLTQQTKIGRDFNPDGKPNLVIELSSLVLDRRAFLQFREYSQPDRYRIDHFEMNAREFMVVFVDPCAPCHVPHSLSLFSLRLESLPRPKSQ